MKFPQIKNRITYSIFILTMFFFASCSSDDDNAIDSSYLNIPDVNFEKALIEQGIDTDGIVNQQMLKTDAEKITSLDLNLSSNFGKINDLTGIEGFVNITLLSAGGQNIEQIDLSKNTLLDSVYLTANKIATIDLSKNVNLIFVDIQSNDLSAADAVTGLENALNLIDLDLSWNYLQEFSINNTSLEILHISHNDLKSLDTNGAVNLRNIFMPSNKLETVDFSTNIALETLLMAGNNLQQISLENNTELTHLYVSSNLFTSLDVSKNNKLEDLRVDRNLSLTCIKIKNDQDIPIVWKSDYQILNDVCN